MRRTRLRLAGPTDSTGLAGPLAGGARRATSVFTSQKASVPRAGGDQVDLALARAEVPLDDAPAVPLEVGRGELLAATAECRVCGRLPCRPWKPTKTRG